MDRSCPDIVAQNRDYRDAEKSLLGLNAMALTGRF